MKLKMKMKKMNKSTTVLETFRSHDAGDFDVGGMSGGPVVGIRRFEGGTKYWPIGIQSGWQKSSRILTVCPFKPFAEHVRDSLQEARAEQG